MMAKGSLAPHLAAQLAGRVLLRAAKDNNGGNRQLATGNRELAIGSDEQYQKSPSWPETGRSCRLFLRQVV